MRINGNGNGNGNGARARRLNNAFRRWRAVHLLTGFVVALWLLLMALTGVLINHQEGLGFVETEVANRYLPDHYTDEFHPETTRFNVVLTDLHSGRFFGENGRLISDFIALLILISVASGVYSFSLRRRLSNRISIEFREPASGDAKPQSVAARPAATERRAPDEPVERKMAASKTV